MKGLRVVQGFCEPGQKNWNKFQNLIKKGKTIKNLVKKAAWHCVPLVLREDRIHSDLLQNILGHVFRYCEQFVRSYVLAKVCGPEHWYHLHIQEHHTRVGAFSPFTNRRRRNTRSTPEFFHLSFRFSPQLCSFNVISTCKWFRVRTYSLGRTYSEPQLIAQAGEPFDDGCGADHMWLLR